MTEEKNEEKKIIKGTVIFKKVDEGSKSERIQPFLKTDDADTRLFLKDSNPFENRQLKAYEGKTVRAEGSFKNEVFIIDSIEFDFKNP